MEQIYNINTEFDKFFDAHEKFNELVCRLKSDETAHMEHGDVEEIVREEGMELLRRMFQGHLDQRAGDEQRQELVTGSDGVKRTVCRKNCTRNVETIFGGVTVRRMGYSARGEKSLFPLDGELNLHSDKYSFGLRRRVAEEVSKSSFDESVKSIIRTTGGKVPKRQMEELADKIARDFDAFYETRRCRSPEMTEDLLIMSMDSKGIVMHEKDLREATRKAAERARKKLRTRLGKGEKRNRKRMATVGTVYTVGRHNRSAEEIMGKEMNAGGKIRPKVRDKRVWASVEREPDAVTDEVFNEALSRDPTRHREWAMLVDGDPHQLDRILSHMKSYGAYVTIIIDFIHLLEYLWKAAYCFHSESSEEAEVWVAERALKILKGQASEAAAGIRRSATLRGLSKKARKSADKCAEYILKYRKLLCYDIYLSRGLPISTGVIEGACRHLIKDRMDLTGARWRLKSAEGVLKLRSLNSSGDFDEYMKFHKAREFERIHKAQYDEQFPLPKAA